MGWQVYDLSRRTLDVGHASFNVSLIGLITFAPLFFLALPAGAVADHHDRKRIVVACYAAELIPAGVLAAAGMLGFASAPLLLGVALLFGTSRAFLQPSMTALAPMLVPRELLPRAIAWNSLAGQLSSILGGAPASILYAGLAPDFTALYQFNIVVPAVPSGNAALTFTLGATAGTQTLYIWVGN